jgi:hypothetical protein
MKLKRSSTAKLRHSFDARLLYFLLASVIVIGIILTADYHDLFPDESDLIPIEGQEDARTGVFGRGAGSSEGDGRAPEMPKALLIWKA